MHPKKTKPATVKWIRVPEKDYAGEPPAELSDGLYYPAHAIGVCNKDHKKWQVQLNMVLPLALEHVTSFDVAIDGGGFIGAWSRLMRFELVMVFEPLEANRRCIEINAPNAVIYPYALSDHVGKLDLYIKDNVFATSRKAGGTTKKTRSYRCMTIDEFHVEPGLIKLDLDGSDLSALHGAKETLERCSPVIIVEHKLDRQAIPEHMKSLGYHSIYSDKRDSIWIR